MGAETNELDTREEDMHRNNGTLREWEWLEEKRHNDEMEAQDMLAETEGEENERKEVDNKRRR